MFKEKLAIIIPTKDRPDDLKNLLESMSMQDVKPVQVIVVDGGARPVRDMLKNFPALRMDYARVAPPSLTVQRNVGIRHLSDEATLAAFLDDDIVLEGESIGNMLKFWEGASSDTGGAGFNITNISTSV